MSQSPLARSTRRSLPAFAHPPSRLSKSTSSKNFRDSPEPIDEDEDSESEVDSPAPALSKSRVSVKSSQSTPTGLSRFSKTKSTSSSTSMQTQAQTQTPVQTPTQRHTPSRTYSSPHTPKIVYSPYATNSPHAGPSRSASIPFDMAASVKDARRKSIGRREETPGVMAREASGSPAPVMVKKGRKGIIRKKPLHKRSVPIPPRRLHKLTSDVDCWIYLKV